MKSFSSIYLSLFLLFAFITIDSIFAEETKYYASDAAAYRGASLAEPSEKGYVLAISVAGMIETRILMENGTEVERFIIERNSEGSTERRYKNKALVEETKSRISGEILEECLYDENAPAKPSITEKKIYEYNKDTRLANVKAYNDKGAMLGSLEYRYDTRGRLVELRATGYFGRARAGLFSTSSAKGGLAASWSDMAGTINIQRFDSEGRTVSTEARQEGKALLRESFIYEEHQNYPRLSYREDLVAGEKTKTVYDSNGNPLAVTITRGKREISHTEFNYNDKGLLVLEVSKHNATSSSRKISYNNDNSIACEEIRKDGVLQKLIFRGNDGSSWEEIYDDFKIVLRAYYLDGRKIREEFLDNGEIVRQRSYP